MKGFGGLPGGNMQGMLKQVQKMQEQLQKTAEQAESFTADGQAGGGVVKAVVNGKMQIESIEVDPSILNADDREVLQEAIMVAVNSALTVVQERKREALEKVTGGMPIPGLF